MTDDKYLRDILAKSKHLTAILGIEHAKRAFAVINGPGPFAGEIEFEDFDAGDQPFAWYAAAYAAAVAACGRLKSRLRLPDLNMITGDRLKLMAPSSTSVMREDRQRYDVMAEKVL